MKALKLLALALLANTALAQTGVQLLGRGLRVTSGGATAGTTCTSITACPGPHLVATMSMTISVSGGLNGNVTVFIGQSMLACPIVMPSTGIGLLVSPNTLFNAVLNQPGSNGCPGRFTVITPIPVGTFALQSLQVTPSGVLAWSTPVRVN